MKHIKASVSVILVLVVAFLVIPASVAEQSEYKPQPGDEVVVYIAKYKPQLFEEGKKLHAKEFAKAMQESGQTRHTYFLEDPENHNVMAISFFAKGHGVEQWHGNDKRQKVLDKLRPMWREPQSVEKFRLIESHTTE